MEFHLSFRVGTLEIVIIISIRVDYHFEVEEIMKCDESATNQKADTKLTLWAVKSVQFECVSPVTSEHWAFKFQGRWRAGFQEDINEASEEVILQTADRVLQVANMPISKSVSSWLDFRNISRELTTFCRELYVSDEEIVVRSWGLVDAHPLTSGPPILQCLNVLQESTVC
jgi:hypothetical protein